MIYKKVLKVVNDETAIPLSRLKNLLSIEIETITDEFDLTSA